MYVCMYIYVCMTMYTMFMCIFMHTWMRINVCNSVCMYSMYSMYVCMYVYTYVVHVILYVVTQFF